MASLSLPVLTLLLLRLVLPLLCRNAGCTSRGGGIDHRRHAQLVTRIPLMPSSLPLTYLSGFSFDSGTTFESSDTHASEPAVRPRARDTSTLKYFGVKLPMGFLDNRAEQIPLTTNACCRWQIGLRSRHKRTITRRRRCIMQSACGRDGAKENWRAHHLSRTHHKRSFFATGSWALGKASKTSKMALVQQDS